jgi:hypothetical protein
MSRRQPLRSAPPVDYNPRSHARLPPERLASVPYLFVPAPLAGSRPLLVSPFLTRWPGPSDDDRRALASMQVLVTAAVERLPVELLWIDAGGRVSRVGATEEAWWRRRAHDHLTVEVPRLREARTG